MSDLEALRAQWTTLYSHTLPQLAKACDPAQAKWPVTLDHCFARIILDNVIGYGLQQWDKVLPKPAVRSMDEQQLRLAIALGEQIKSGEADLCCLDEISLRCRGKHERKYGDDSSKQAGSTSGRKRSLTETDEPQATQSKKTRLEKSQSTLNFQLNAKDAARSSLSAANPAKTREVKVEEVRELLDRVQSHPSLTPYRKKLYTTLLSVPRGRYTTYAAMSNYLESSARAVGNGMRNNPFAPEVPCHRVLAANGSIGGFHGHWGKDGKYANKKIEMLRGEGVRFDAQNGKVVGEPFTKFHCFQTIE